MQVFTARVQGGAIVPVISAAELLRMRRLGEILRESLLHA